MRGEGRLAKKGIMIMSKLTAEQFGKLVHLLADNGYAVIPFGAFGGAFASPAPQPAKVAAPPAVEAEGERKYKCSVCGEEGHNARTCPTKNAPSPAPTTTAPAVQAPPALDLDSFDLDLGDLGGAPGATPKAQAAPKSAPAPKAKPTPAPAPSPTVASKADIDSELDALFNFG